MRIKLIALGGVILALSLTLSGCGSSGGVGNHSNVLLTADLKDAAQFLTEAGIYASEKTNLTNDMDSAYTICATDPKYFDDPFNSSEKNPCGNYFKVMVQYAKKTSGVFRHITVSNLTDKQVSERMGILVGYLQFHSDKRGHLNNQELETIKKANRIW